MISKHFDHRKHYVGQDEADKKRCHAEVSCLCSYSRHEGLMDNKILRQFPKLDSHYVNAWPVEDFMKLRLNYTVGRFQEGKLVEQHSEYRARVSSA